MRLLVDTNVLLRYARSAPPLPDGTRRAIVEAEELYVTAVSRAEIGIKASIGKLRLPKPEPAFWSELVARLQAIELAFDSGHAALLAELPLHHRDPFDRMIACQCLAAGLKLATVDPVFRQYGIETV
ncbi:MAG: type II toxin-antitoxin system VapC family toxin [Fimbriimonadaceae bacterium]|nr:type II toxin-antitoxin system VapC family toxin [Fimbriimonadaceae bacterium]